MTNITPETTSTNLHSFSFYYKTSFCVSCLLPQIPSGLRLFCLPRQLGKLEFRIDFFFPLLYSYYKKSGSTPLRNTRHRHRTKELSSWLLHTASAFCNWITRFEKASNYLLTWLAFGQDRRYYRPHLHLNRSSPKQGRFHRWGSPRRQAKEECRTERPSFLARPGTGNGLWVELIWNKAS